MRKYLFVFAQSHNNFRIPEILSIAELYGFALHFPENSEPSSGPFLVIDLEAEDHARMLAKRCILIKSVYEFWGKGSTYEDLHKTVRANKSLWDPYQQNTSFRFLITAYNHTIPQYRQRQIMEDFSYMAYLGKIDLRDPELIMGCHEEYDDSRGLSKNRNVDGQFRQVYFGRLIEDGSARALIGRFDVKKRVYYGNTSMDAEMSLLMANQTKATSGSLIYDPFMGTGSMAYPAAHFGALVVGSDIDGRQMRGKEKPPGVIRAATQYGLSSRVVDLLTFDMTRNPWRCGNLFDAIVTDPPYGVRAGAKRLGRKREPSVKHQEVYRERLASGRTDEPYIPPTKPYELSELARDLVLLSRYLLKPGGRLVFFLPTVTDEYEEVDIQTMLCEGMTGIANSLQDFGSWGRRLITVQKTTSASFPAPVFDTSDCSSWLGPLDHVPAHRDFREKYFQGFKKDGN